MVFTLLDGWFVVWVEMQRGTTENLLNTRLAHWNRAVSSLIEVGDRRDTVQRRLHTAFPAETRGIEYDQSDSDDLSFVPETVDAAGFAFPCTAWLISVEIRFDPEGRVIERKVRPVGVCV